MGTATGIGFKKKHPHQAQCHPAVRDEISKRGLQGEIPCPVAFDIAAQTGLTPAEVGQTIDLLELRLAKCQLGLFGHTPDKKRVTAEKTDNTALLAAIEDGMRDQRLSCLAAWDLAARFKVGKMVVSNTCEALGARIKPCQLGAF